ncbi:MAG: polysaccharide deacetylase family protein [Betaproteobacteria bacterium]
MSSIPILTYHSLNIDSNNYLGNDHVAFREDLRLLTALGWRVIPALDVARLLVEPSPHWPQKCVAITFDDGTNFDFEDLPHPSAGDQRSMLNIMRDFDAEFPGAQPSLHATSFVIASREARATMDRSCILGRGWWSDSWWKPAVESGVFHVANHSWDHCHDSLPLIAQRDQLKGTFIGVDTRTDADLQIKVAAAFIANIAPNPGVSLFAYPYGHSNPYLLEEYLPQQAKCDLPFVTAAFSTEPIPVTSVTNRWKIPRYVCGHHWKSAGDLKAILRDAA